MDELTQAQNQLNQLLFRRGDIETIQEDLAEEKVKLKEQVALLRQHISRLRSEIAKKEMDNKVP